MRKNIITLSFYILLFYSQYVILSIPNPTVNYIISPPHYKTTLFFVQALGSPTITTILLWVLIFGLIYPYKKKEITRLIYPYKKKEVTK